MPGIRIAVLYPLSTAAQGDEGNARVLAHRAGLRDVRPTVTTVVDEPVPDADILLVGGLDDDGMPVLTRRLREGGLAQRVRAGAVVLAVNAGYQVLGRTYETPDGSRHEGLALLDVTSHRAQAAFEGPVITRPDAELGLAAMSGYESHVGTTVLGPGVERFVELELGHGNDGHSDGARAGRVVATYVHGPLLARNADLADVLLGWALGSPLAPAPADMADALRTQRITEDRADPSGWGGRAYGRVRRRPARRRRRAQGAAASGSCS